MRQHHGIAAILIILLLIAAADSSADAGLVVVVNAQSGVQTLTHEEIVNIFLGRFRRLPSGMAALPVDQPPDQPLRAEFYRRLVNKTPAEIRAYWARLVFSGKTSPPHQAATQSEVLQWMRDNPGAVGYLSADQVQPPLVNAFGFPP